MISLLLFILASICSASMDTVLFHYEKSIFVKFNKPQYFNSYVSWTNKYIDGDFKKGLRKLFKKFKTRFKILKWIGNIDYPAFLTDAFHLFKTTMIFLTVGAIISYRPTLSYFDLDLCKPLLYLFDFVLFGTLWNCSFSLFFNKLLVKNK